jgi:hypothetical protein
LNVPEKARLDTLHIACAVLNEIDYILSWNFKHIANVRTRGKIRKAVDKEYDGRFADYVKKLIEDQKSTKINKKRMKKTLQLAH